MNAETLKVIMMQNLWQKQENQEAFQSTNEDQNTKVSEFEN